MNEAKLGLLDVVVVSCSRRSFGSARKMLTKTRELPTAAYGEGNAAFSKP